MGSKSENCAKTQVFIGIQETQLYLGADDNSFTSQKFQIPDFPGFRDNGLLVFSMVIFLYNLKKFQIFFTKMSVTFFLNISEKSFLHS